ncbi:MAG: hypothetical protein ACYSW8_29185 [Planctomycetota bacterium]|jgi:hypothetical protein
MGSATFHRLYANAMRREHELLDEVQQLCHTDLVTSFPQAVRLARGLLQIHTDYLEGLKDLVLKHRLRLRGSLFGKVCSECGSPDCSGASLGSPPMLWGIELLKQALMGKIPPLQPPPTAT